MLVPQVNDLVLCVSCGASMGVAVVDRELVIGLARMMTTNYNQLPHPTNHILHHPSPAYASGGSFCFQFFTLSTAIKLYISSHCLAHWLYLQPTVGNKR